MKTQYLLIPHKHLRVSDSLIGLGGIIYSNVLLEPKTIDQIWMDLEKMKIEKIWNGYISFSNVVLALDILFACNLILHLENDLICRESVEK